MPAQTAAAPVADRIAALDWPALTAQLDDRGFAQTGPVLDAAECAALAAQFDDGRFRSRVDMREAGIARFLTQKLSWNRFNPPEHHTFTWQGIDGSEVLTHFPPHDTYNAEATVAELRRGVRACDVYVPRWYSK